MSRLWCSLPTDWRRTTACIAGAFLLLASAALADVVVLKNGMRIEGEVIDEAGTEVKVRSISGGVYSLAKTDIVKIEREDAGNRVERAKDPSADDTARYERWTGAAYTVVSTPHFIVRGTHPEKDLRAVSAAAERTLQHFLQVFECEVGDVIRSVRGYAPRAEIFQFRLEQDYLRFLDKVVAREKDSGLDEQRQALARRQRGFWVLSPRIRVVGYQGPGPLESVPSRVAHKTSHVLLLEYKTRQDWRPWWFLEGFAAWQEMEATGVCLTYCLDVSEPGAYANRGTPEADEYLKSRTADQWRRHVQSLVAGGRELDLGVLGKRALNELNLDEVVQSWSVVVWLQNQRKLVAFTDAYKEHGDFAGACEHGLGMAAPEAEAAWRAWVRAGARIR